MEQAHPVKEPLAVSDERQELPAIEHRQAQVADSLQLRPLAVLHEVSIAATSSLDLHSILRILTDKIGLLLPYSAVLIWLVNEEEGVLARVASRNIDEELGWRAEMEKLPPLPQAVLESRAPVSVGNIQADRRVSDPDFFRRHGLISYLGVPLIAKGKALGVLSVFTKWVHFFTQDEIKFVSMIAGQAAISIYNSRLYEQLERKTRAISALYSVATALSQSFERDFILRTITHEVLGVFGFDAACFYLCDRDGGELRLVFSAGFLQEKAPPPSLKPGQGIVGRVFGSGEPLFFEDIQNHPVSEGLAWTKTALGEGFRGAFFIPVSVKGRTLGVIGFLSKSVHRFSAGDTQLVRSISDHIAVAVEHIELYEETRRQALQLAQDVAERRRAEEKLRRAHEELKRSHEKLQAAQSQLIQAEKMGAIGQLASGVAHEVKNPLAVILQGVGYLERELGSDGDGVARVLEMMKEAIARADKTISGLLNFARPAPLELRPADIGELIQASLELVQRQLTVSGIKITQQIAPGLPPVMADPNQIKQVFINLFLNAFQAMPGGGNLTIRCYTGEPKKSRKGMGYSTQSSRAAETAIICEVEDSGVGIPKKNLPKVFDPFFSTKPVGQGTGLGLSVTRSIVEAHAGLIEIASQEGLGTKVTLSLPAAKSEKR